jgi:hypothetical protein
LEGKELGKSAGSAKGKSKIEAYDKDRKKGSGALITPAKVCIFSSLHCFLISVFYWLSADASLGALNGYAVIGKYLCIC